MWLSELLYPFVPLGYEGNASSLYSMIRTLERLRLWLGLRLELRLIQRRQLKPHSNLLKLRGVGSLEWSLLRLREEARSYDLEQLKLELLGSQQHDEVEEYGMVLRRWFELCRLIILLLNILCSVFFFGWPDGLRLLSTTMPWNIPPSLLVLWGVCWMFAPYEEEVRNGNSPGRGFVDIDPHILTFDDKELMPHDNYGEAEILPSALDPLSQDFFLSYTPIFEDHNGGLCQVEPVLSMQAASQNTFVNGADSLPWGGNSFGVMGATSEFNYFPSLEPHRSFQAADTIQQYSNPPKNGFQALGTDDMSNAVISTTLQTLQTLESFHDLISDGGILFSQRPPSQSQTTNPLLESRGRTRRDPTPNEQGLYVCKHEECAKDNRTFRLLCHWHKHMDKHERIYRCLQPECSERKGFTYAGGLKRHENDVHKMHRSVEFYCPHAGCSRAEGGERPFPRNENLADHLKRKHQEKVTTSCQQSLVIASGNGLKRKREFLITDETKSSEEIDGLKSAIKRLERRIEQLEEVRLGQNIPEEAR